MPKRPALDLNGPGASPAEQQEAPKKKKQQRRKPALALTPPEGIETPEDDEWVPKHLTAAQFEALSDDEKALVRKFEGPKSSWLSKDPDYAAQREQYYAIIDRVAAQTDPNLAPDAAPTRPQNRGQEFWAALTTAEQYAIDWSENLDLSVDSMLRRVQRMNLTIIEGKTMKRGTFQGWVRKLREKYPAPSPTAFEKELLSDQPRGKALIQHYKTTIMPRQLPSERFDSIQATAVKINKKFTTQGDEKAAPESHDQFVARITARAQAQQQQLIEAAQQKFDPNLPDFTTVNYTELPHTVLLDIAAGRDLLPYGRGVQDYSRLLDLLWQDDAERGILPIGVHILQVTSRPILAAHRLSAIAEKNQKALQDLARRQGVSEPDFERQSDWTKLFNADFAKEGKKQRHNVLTSDCARRLLELTRKGFHAHCLTLSTSHLRFIMEFLDALEGIPPQALEFGDTKYHRMSVQQLKEYGQSMGMPLKVGGRLLKKEDLVAWLMEKSPSSALSEPLSNEQMSILVSQVRPHVAEIPKGLGLMDVGDLNTTNCTDIMVTHTQGLLAEREVFEKLEAAVFDGFMPDLTSPDRCTQLLDALACALRARQSKDFSAESDSGITNTLNADMVGRLMFSDYQDLIVNGSTDEEESHDQLSFHGTPTPEYEKFLGKILHPFSGTAEYDRLRTVFTQVTDIQPLHAAVLPSFLHENDLILSNYPIGILIAGGVNADGSSKPATARIIRSNESMGDPLWLLSYQSGTESHSHFWAPFVASGSLWDMLRQFGLHLLYDVDLPAPSAVPLADQSERAVKKRIQEKKTRKQKKISDGCSACSDGGRADCNGAPDMGCSSCRDLGISCEFAPHQIAKHQYDLSRSLMGLELSEVTDDMITNWETSDADLEAVNEFAQNAQPTPIDGDTVYFVVVICMRCSSTPTAAYFQLLLQRALGYSTRYNIMLNDPTIVATEGQRPGGAGTQMQSYFKVFTAPGFRPVPSQVTNNMTQPLDIGFVNHLHHVVSPQNPNKPIRYQFVTAGLAGNAVGIDAYGSRTHGFFKFVLDNDPQLADRIDVVNVIEPHVYSGFPHSIPLARRPYFTFYSGKYVIKNKLADLLDYFYQIQNAAINNAQPPPFNNDPVYSHRLLSHILLADDSWAWRARHLHAGTQPTDAEVHARNVNRNGPWP